MRADSRERAHIHEFLRRYDPHSARSCAPANKERGGGALRPGVGSPLKIFALARCMQHEMTVYHLRISSDGSSSKCAAFRRASFWIKLFVSLAIKPCRSKANAQKSKGCKRRPVWRSNTGCSAFFRRAQSSATLPGLFSQPG